jgi:uncharacterized protein YukE
MTRLYVDHDKLIDLSQKLYDKSDEIGEVIKKMYSTVEKIDEAWDGPDSMIFRAQAGEYIENLQRIQFEVMNCSDKMLKNENRYTKAFIDYFSKFEKEDKDRL